MQCGMHLSTFHVCLMCLAGLQTTDESMVPLLINCWPSASGGESYVNIEYESTTDFDLQNVAIAIPLPALASTPKVNQVCWNHLPCVSLLLCAVLCCCKPMGRFQRTLSAHIKWQAHHVALCI